jgi:hypothetical protein
MLKKMGISRTVKFMIRGLPLVGAIVASQFALSVRASQFLILIVLIWLQVFVVTECFMYGR